MACWEKYESSPMVSFFLLEDEETGEGNRFFCREQHVAIEIKFFNKFLNPAGGKIV